MKRKDELLQRAQRDLEAFVEERLGLEQELTQRQQKLTQQVTVRRSRVVPARRRGVRRVERTGWVRTR